MIEIALRTAAVRPLGGLLLLLVGCASDSSDTASAVQAEPTATATNTVSTSSDSGSGAAPPATVPMTVPIPATTAPPATTTEPSASGNVPTSAPDASGPAGPPAPGGNGGGAGVPNGGTPNVPGSGGGSAAGAAGLGGTAGSAPVSGEVAGSSGTAGAGTGGGGGAGGVAGGNDEAQSAGCGAARTLMDGRRTIQSGGMNREYILRVPEDYDENHPYRLVIAFHWLSGNADQVANGGGSTEDPYYGLWDLAENSTIFVAPEGLDAGWANSGDRDIALTDAILEEIQADLCIDTQRIFATGFSYGAGMSYALACARADVFRGVVLYAGAQLSGCNGGTTPIAYFHAHGVVDSVLNIAQGRQLRDRFVEVNGCTAQNPPEPGQNSGTHTCTSYEGCMEGYPVRWCPHGGDHNPTEKDQGQSESWVPPEAWAFIAQF